jgi:squalene-hopene/tetraprenyl-beta-curcumene cyclase
MTMKNFEDEDASVADRTAALPAILMAQDGVRKVGGKLVRLSRVVRGLRAGARAEGPRRAPETGRSKTPSHPNESRAGAVLTGLASNSVQQAIDAATRALLDRQRPDGHFVFELEADATIPAEYVLLVHWLGETPDLLLERRIGAYLRRVQGEHGGWPLFDGGDLDVSASVKAYFALKMIGDDVEAPHMARARAAVLAHGGAAHSNVFTRSLLALYGAIPWRAVPVTPVEILLLPRWFPFHLTKISYWARTVLVPLTVLYALRPLACNPRQVLIPELFCAPAEGVRRWPKGGHHRFPWAHLFGAIDRVLQVIQPHFPLRLRRRAIDKAVRFTTERLNGLDGLGAIFPAMANAVMMFQALGYRPDHPDRAAARCAIDRLLIVKEDEAYCQPCVSPVWDTALAVHALLEAGAREPAGRARRALEWLQARQVLDTPGDWSITCPGVRPGGWAFQYANPHYPDVDDTAVVLMAMDRATREAPLAARVDFSVAIERGLEWVLGMQSRDGGFGAFDADNDHEYLNHISFADHGALLDPPTADVTARCVSLLGQLSPGTQPLAASLERAVMFLRRTQEPDGSWYGRWGMNYIYGTWSSLCALAAAGIGPEAPEMQRAAGWLEAIQNPDFGWGEDGASYQLDYRGYQAAPSTASQTAWALLGLMAAGRVDGSSVERGIRYLQRTQGADGFWPETRFTATGFPRVFYLRYHGYSKYFPLWALARFRNLKTGLRTARHGM